MTKLSPACHPERKHHAKGFCKSCYYRGRIGGHSSSSAKSRWERYNMTENDFNSLWDKQGGRCALCSVPLTFGTGGLAVDHDHLCCPGRVNGNQKRTCGKCTRGLLCLACNHALGTLGDTVEGLQRAIVYLEGNL